MPKVNLTIRKPEDRKISSETCAICKRRRAFNKSFYTDKPTCEKCHKRVKSELLKKFKRLYREDKGFRDNFLEHFKSCKNPKCNKPYCYLVLGIWKKKKRRKTKLHDDTCSVVSSWSLEAQSGSSENLVELLEDVKLD
tara:strand:+ start:677 stop:1090 length:414 start_codon:yes stop_codon:yes gene_type:complete